MSNRIAIIIAGVIVLALVTDRIFNTGDATMFLIRKIVDLIEYLAFWR